MDKMLLSDLPGKVMLIDLTYYSREGALLEQKQCWGTVTAATEQDIQVRLSDGEAFHLPPDLSSTKIAPKGEYRLRSTGEIVTDPDYLTTWNITMG